jgi:diaminopimelate epimerase
MRFVKAHAYGNDFLFVKKSDVGRTSLASLARQLCDRHMGIGADGLAVYEEAGADVRTRLFNANGSQAEVSGNGVRALAALLLREDARPNAEVTVHTDAGPKRLTRLRQDGARQLFRAAMGLPTELRQVRVEIAGDAVPLVVLNMGNPQCVVLGPLPDDRRFRHLGSGLERHSMFPTGTNVEFVQVESPDRVRILIWERGVGPTASSGTGSCAALVAAASYGGAAREADVIAPGGRQRVEWRDDSVYLTGWAEVLCVGEWLRPLPT